MIILSNGSLTKAGRFAPETMALNLSERGSTATITYKIGLVNLTVGDWLQDDTEPGAGIVWRVKTIDTQYNTETVTVQLEDMISSLNDQIINGKITPAIIVGLDGVDTCTARQAVEYILNKQSTWRLDDFDYGSVSKPYNFNGDSLKAALEMVSSSLTDPVWSYDFTTYPFKISITQESNSIDSEMRMSRNISTLKVSVDRTRMYTRFYPIGKNNLRLEAPGYVQKNVSTYGLIEKTETDESHDTQEKLLVWANERLNLHAQPIVTVTVNGLDLSADTGEALDSFTIGRKCRLPLPEFNTTITEKITKLSWKNKLAEPKNVMVTMANMKEDIASIVNRLASGSGRSGRTKATDDEEDHAWIVDTTDHVSLIAEAVAGKDQEGKPNWSRVSELTVDGNGIDARVTEAEGDIITNAAEILMTQSMIHSAVWTANSILYSYIDQTSTYIMQTVGNEVDDLHSEILQTQTMIRNAVWTANSEIYSYIEQTATSIMSVVGSEVDDLHSEISQTQSMIHSAVWTANSEIFSYIDQTATYILNVVGNIESDLGSAILQTAGEIRAEVHASSSELYSYVDQTATYMISVVEDAKLDLGSDIMQTASQIRAEVHAANSTLYSYIDQTATYIETIIIDVENDLGSALLVTASQIRAEVHSANSELYSYIDQTATYIESVVANIESDLGSDILQTANEIRAEVHAANSELYSYVDQTATYIESVVADVEQGLGSDILQTANEIRADVYASDSELYSYVSRTATSIYQVVADTEDDLQSSIDQQADRISLVVSGTGSNAHIRAGEIATSINSQTGQSIVKLSADVIDIDGDTIVDWLEGEDIVCAEIEAGSLVCGGTVELDVDAPIIGAGGGTTGDIGGLVIGVSKNTTTGEITLTQLDGTVTTFSKATSINRLTGNWSGSAASGKTLTVVTDPLVAGIDYTVGFGGNYGAHDTEFEVTANGAITKSVIMGTQYINAPVKVSYLTGMSSAPVDVYTDTVSFSPAALLQSKRFEENGTFTPDPDYIGFSSIEVDASDLCDQAYEDGYNYGWNNARSLTVNNLPSGIGSYVDGIYAKIAVKYPSTNGDPTLTSKEYSLSLNSSFRPSGSSVTIRAVELKNGSTVVARIDASDFYMDGYDDGYDRGYDYGYDDGVIDGRASVTHNVTASTGSSWYTWGSETDAKSAAATAMGVSSNRIEVLRTKSSPNTWCFFKANCSGGGSTKYYIIGC